MLQEKKNKPIVEEIEPQIKKGLSYNYCRKWQTNWQTTIFKVLIVTDVSPNSSFISHQIRNLSVLFASILQEEKNKPIQEEIEPQIKKQLSYNYFRAWQTNWQTIGPAVKFWQIEGQLTG